jgi:hypothetical protein
VVKQDQDEDMEVDVDNKATDMEVDVEGVTDQILDDKLKSKYFN